MASTPPIAPSTIPSMTNGQRMNQSVAPTSFITSTSRRRENIDSRIVFEMSRIARDDEQPGQQADRELHHARGDEDLLRLVARGS